MSIELNAANTLLDQGVKVPVKAPLLLRLFGKKHIKLVIRAPYLGTLLRISAIYERMQITPEQLKKLDDDNIHQLFLKHTKKCAEIAAQCMLNNFLLGKLLGPLLSVWLLWKLSPGKLMQIAQVMGFLTEKEAFTHTIRLVSTLTMMKPNLSQEEQRS